MNNQTFEKSTIDVLFDEFKTSLSDLIECYTGVPPEIIEGDSDNNGIHMTSIVSLCDSRIAASVILATNADIASALAVSKPPDLSDWLGELCNQLAGRYKNKLTLFGLCPFLSAPTTVSGKELKITGFVVDKQTYTARFLSGAMVAQLNFHVRDETLELNVDTEQNAADEGSLLMF